MNRAEREEFKAKAHRLHVLAEGEAEGTSNTFDRLPQFNDFASDNFMALLAEMERLEKALIWISRVNACDYEYQGAANEVLNGSDRYSLAKD